MLRSTLRTLTQCLTSTSHRPARAAARRPTLTVEGLEDRQLLSASLSALTLNPSLGPPALIGAGRVVLPSPILQLASLSVGPAALPSATAGFLYDTALSASGGSGHYLFSLASGSLPPGLSLGSNGVISGTTTVAGRFDFVAGAADTQLAAFGTRAYTLTVNGGSVASIVLTPSATATAVGGTVIVSVTGRDPFSNPTSLFGTVTLTSSNNRVLASQSAAAVNGQATFTLPAQAAGTATLQASIQENFPFDFNPSFFFTATLQSNSAAVTVAPPLTLSAAPPPAATAGQTYLSALGATGGSGLYGFALLAGNLPAGLSLSSAGVLSGSTTTAGTFGILVRASDTVYSGVSDFRGYTFTVNPDVASSITLTPSTTQVVLGSSFNVAVQVRDRFGNLANSVGSVQLTMTSNDGTGAVLLGTTAPLSNGQGTPTLFASQAGTGTLVATAGALRSNGATIAVTMTQQQVVQALHAQGLTDADIQSLGTAVRAALRGPEADSVRFNGAQFNVMPVQKISDAHGITYVGHITHHQPWPASDDQFEYHVRIDDSGAVHLQVNINRRGFASLVAPLASVAFYLTNIQMSYADKLLIENFGPKIVQSIEDHFSGDWQTPGRFLIKDIAAALQVQYPIDRAALANKGGLDSVSNYQKLVDTALFGGRSNSLKVFGQGLFSNGLHATANADGSVTYTGLLEHDVGLIGKNDHLDFSFTIRNGKIVGAPQITITYNGIGAIIKEVVSIGLDILTAGVTLPTGVGDLIDNALTELQTRIQSAVDGTWESVAKFLVGEIAAAQANRS